MNSNPKISVVIPSLNKVKYVAKTLDSIINQNYPNLEIIIEDGGSTDGTLELLKKYKKNYPEIIKLESRKDEGQTDAVNRGMGKSSGEILTFINADDLYEKGAFELVSSSYKENPGSLWFVGKGRVINEKDSEIAKVATAYKNLLLSHSSYNLLLITNFLMQPSVFITRKCWNRYKPFSGKDKYIMEYDMWLKIIKSQKPVLINKYLSSFRIPSISFSKNRYKDVLSEDFVIMRKNTDNPVLFFLHKIHNILRVLIVRSL